MKLNIKEKLSSSYALFKGAGFLKQGLVVLVLGGLVYFGISSLSAGDDVGYRTEKVKKGVVVSSVSETGEITSGGEVEVLAWNGLVEEVYVENDDVVVADQPLFKTKGIASAQEMAKAYSDYLTAKKNLNTAESTLYTLQSGAFAANSQFINDVVARELDETDPTYIQQHADWLAAEAKYLDQQTAIDQAKAGLSNSWLNYQSVAGGVVKAPVAGKITNVAVSKGQVFSSKETALIIKSEGDVWVSLAVSEMDVLKIELGQKVKVTVDALGEERYEGTVRRVDSVGSVDTGVVSYRVYVILTEENFNIRSGMTVQAEIETMRKSDVLTISSSALKLYQGERAVQILDVGLGEPIYVPVEVGVEGEMRVEIVSGLSEGEEIIVSIISKGTSGGGGVFPGMGGGK